MDKLEMRDDSHAFGKATITVVGEHAIIYPIVLILDFDVIQI